MMLTMGFICIVILLLRHNPSSLSLFRDYITKQCQVLSNVSFCIVEIIIY